MLRKKCHGPVLEMIYRGACSWGLWKAAACRMNGRRVNCRERSIGRRKWARAPSPLTVKDLRSDNGVELGEDIDSEQRQTSAASASFCVCSIHAYY